MSEKARDKYNRWRSVTIGFRVSPEENKEIDHMVKISGLTKQDYLSARVHEKKITVLPNPRVYKGLKSVMQDILDKLNTITECPDEELQETIRIVAKAMDEMKGDK